jgi:hypothetical protein
MLKRIFFLAALCMPLVLWAFFKPMRVVAPELAGVICVNESICVDDLRRADEATKLYAEAVSFVEASVGRLDSRPRAIFCSSFECSKSFGFGSNSAYNVETWGVVVSYRGRKDYYVRHELIRHLQNEHLGSMNAWIHTPKWFLEGMAYSLSEDPRKPLSEPLQSYRARYEEWVKKIKHFWAETARL